ncbi:hypothetical protein KR222_005849 [Zaprionus bogoriensis]|nr:hypothetical protein KR222_005849 [Zaprionus bogoriensis]
MQEYIDMIAKSIYLLQLNGSDITSLSNCEAVQMFLQAKETLIVELLRKTSATEIKQDDVLDTDRSQNRPEEPAVCAEVIENIEILNSKRTCSPKNVNVNFDTNDAFPPQKKSKIVLTLRAFLNSEHNVAVPDKIPPPFTALSKETQTMDDYVHVPERHNENIDQTADHFIEQEHHLFEQCLEPEIDIEEVTLLKDSEPMGLSVCSTDFFSNCDEGIKPMISTNVADVDGELQVEENVFISDIQTDSIAGRDGRLRRGDQILRINGIDIKSKKHAETEITEKGVSVTLLVSRILYPEDEDDEDDDSNSNFEYANRFLTDDYTNVVDKLEKVLLSQRQSIPSTKDHILPTPETVANTEGTGNTSRLPSANQNIMSDGISEQLVFKRIHTNLVNRKPYDYDDCEHIYETIPEDSESEPLYCSPYQSSNYMTAIGSCSSSDALKMQQQTRRVAHWLGIRPQNNLRSMHTLSTRSSVYNKNSQERILNRVCSLRSGVSTTSRSSSSGAGYSADGHNDNGDLHKNHDALQEEVDNSSSAYNTGDSNNSTSPHQNLNVDNENAMSAIQGVHTMQSQSSIDTILNSPASSNLIGPCSKTSRILFSTSGSASSHILTQKGNSSLKLETKHTRGKPVEDQVPCPQFNAPNLSRYHFVSSQEVASKYDPRAKSSSVFVTSNTAEEVPMVWKVKRRPDGSRYIVKRPIRNHVNHLGVRKNLQSSEKNTTPDDALSDVKIGRCFIKEESKRHIERVRERRQHQQLQH